MEVLPEAEVALSGVAEDRHDVLARAELLRDLEVVAQRTNGRQAAVSFLFGIPSGRHVARDDVVREVVNRVRLEPASPGDTVPYQIDGDVVGTLPVEISMDPRPLSIRLPVAD